MFHYVCVYVFVCPCAVGVSMCTVSLLLMNFRHVTFHMKSQMVRSCKASFTNLTPKGLSTRVFTVVPGQFVRSSESPRTLGPSASVRLFT